MIYFLIGVVVFLLIGLWMSFFWPARLFFDMMFDNVIVRGSRKEKNVAITFDDGPHPIYTPQVLDVLREKNVTATFFLTGENTDAHPQIAKRIFDEGHDVGVHSYEHLKLIYLKRNQIEDQLKRTEEAIIKAIGQRPKLFRPPYGFRDPRVLSIAKKMGYNTVIWDVTAFDWKMPGVGKIVETIMRQTDKGSVILLHDGRGDRSQTVEALKIIIDKLEENGYNFVTISKMIKNDRREGKIQYGNN